jgi:hypothetical protein
LNLLSFLKTDFAIAPFLNKNFIKIQRVMGAVLRSIGVITQGVGIFCRLMARCFFSGILNKSSLPWQLVPGKNRSRVIGVGNVSFWRTDHAQPRFTGTKA